jgi:pimeloyl-ACP methyl ester carboxylesterase
MTGTEVWELRGDAAAPAVLLVPPLGRGGTSWEQQAQALTEDFRCVLFDPRGIGRAKDAPTGPCSADTMAEDALAVLEATGIERAHVVGWSMGAAAAMVLALAHPERVSSLSLLTPWARTDTHLGTAFRMLRDLVSRAPLHAAEIATLWLILSRSAVNGAGPGLLDQARAAVDDPGYPDAEVLAGYLDAAIAFDVLGRLGSITIPTLVVGGTDDRLVDVDHAREVAATIPGARLHVLDGVGATHALPVERADEVNVLLAKFIASHV